MRLFFIALIAFFIIPMGFGIRVVNAQIDLPDDFPFPTTSETPLSTPLPEPSMSPIASDMPVGSEPPIVSPSPVPTPVIPSIPSIPSIILPIIVDPSPMALPSATPRPTLPLFFQTETTPTPPPEISGFTNQSFEYSTYRSIVVPALSFVTHTNVEEFYKDSSLPEHTANLLYSIALVLMATGISLSCQNLISETIRKVRQKELVQYLKSI